MSETTAAATRQRHLLLGLVMFLVSMALLGCTGPELVCDDPLGCVTIGPNEPIQIATLLAETGGAATLGLDARGGVEMALVERENELLGHSIVVTQEDSACSPTVARAAMARISTAESHLGIIGPTCTAVVPAVLPAVDALNAVLISPAANGIVEATGPVSGSTTFFRTIPAVSTQGLLAAQFASEQLGVRRAAVISDGSDYADQLQAAFAGEFRRLGGEVVFTSILVIGQTELTGLASAITANDPDLLYMPMFAPEANYLLTRLAEDLTDLTALYRLGADNLFDPLFPQATGPAVEGMYLTAPALSGEAYEAFLERWQTRYGALPAGHYHAHAYDAANMLLDAIEAVAQVGPRGQMLVGRQALRDALLAVNGRAGLAGPLQCQPTGDCGAIDALGVYELSLSELSGLRWPPPVVWSP